MRRNNLGIMILLCGGLTSMFGCAGPERAPADIPTTVNLAPITEWTPTVPPGSWQGAEWPTWVPTWLDLDPVLRAAAIAEISGVRIPLGWSVVIMDPGSFSTKSSPTGLAAGLTDGPNRRIYVAWRFPKSLPGPLLPALLHELGHVLNPNDPDFGH